LEVLTAVTLKRAFCWDAMSCTANEIKENATRQLMAIPKKEFSDCFEKWKERWDKCVRSQGEYFEGD
jgi:hypothetical protein